MTDTALPPPGALADAPLCPHCFSASVLIYAHVPVVYHVQSARQAPDLVVVNEQVGDGEWDRGSRASCTVCDWSGIVGELLSYARAQAKSLLS